MKYRVWVEYGNDEIIYRDAKTFQDALDTKQRYLEKEYPPMRVIITSEPLDKELETI